MLQGNSKRRPDTGVRICHFLLSLRTTVAFCDEFIDVYLARDLVKSTQHLDEGEAIDVEAHDVDELCEMIYAGKYRIPRRFLQSSPIRIC